MMSVLAAATLALSAVVAAPGDAADWQTDYGKALSATRADDRPLLVVLDDSTKTDAQVDEALLEGKGMNDDLLAAYQLCHVDVSTDYGKKVAKVFGATELPHTTIIDKTGQKILYKNRGDIDANQWKLALNTYKKGELVRQMTQPYTTYFRGEVSTPVQSSSNYVQPATTIPMSTPAVSTPGYCPSCQRNAGF
ncbi:MAG: hypothetical protein RH917_10230 [Lacipirellulaceae bacterium]